MRMVIREHQRGAKALPMSLLEMQSEFGRTGTYLVPDVLSGTAGQIKSTANALKVMVPLR
jgi:hypothetical protein